MTPHVLDGMSQIAQKSIAVFFLGFFLHSYISHPLKSELHDSDDQVSL